MPMATKYSRVVTYHEVLPPIKSHVPLKRSLTKLCHKLEALYLLHYNWSFTSRVLLATKLGRMVTNLEWLLYMKSYQTLITWSCKFTGHENYFISTTAVLMAATLARLVTYHDGLPPIT